MVEFIGKGPIPAEVLIQNSLELCENVIEAIVVLKYKDGTENILSTSKRPWLFFSASIVLQTEAIKLLERNSK